MVSKRKLVLDWWILTFLPLLILAITLGMSLLVKGWETTLKLAVEQLLSFSLVLSTSDLAIRATRFSQDDKETSRLIPLIPIIISSGLLFTYVVINSSQEYWKHYFFLALGILTTIFSLFSYYKNQIYLEDNLAVEIVKEKKSQEQEDMLNFEESENEDR